MDQRLPILPTTTQEPAMTTKTYIVTEAFAASVLEIKNPWFIVNEDYVVGVYAGRSGARAAKTADKLAGKIVPLNEITLKTAEAFEHVAPIDMIVESAAVEESKPFGYETHGLTHCPSCGAHLNNGVGVHNQDVNGKPVKHDQFEYSCLACDAEFGPAIKGKKAPKVKAEVKPIENRSTVEKPCKLVWQLADDMPGAHRKDVIAAAEAKGVAYYTARTQYQLWAQIQKEMAEREAATKK